MLQQQSINFSKVLEEVKSGKGQLVDVREQSEWQRNRFECAIHLPLSGLSKGIGLETLRELKQANKTIYLHCRSGARVRQAKKILARFGCTQVQILPVSMLQMLEKGFRLK